MRLDGFGLFVNDMAKMIRFYRDVLGFEIKEGENTGETVGRNWENTGARDSSLEMMAVGQL